MSQHAAASMERSRLPAGESRVNAARLALEDLARFEGSDPQLSLFRRRLDGTLAIAGARLGAAQQAAVKPTR
eukprot:scaffold8008_cov122-Isochrysis_galbana.AAC.4